MPRIGFISLILGLLISIDTPAQSFYKYQEGAYYDLAGNKVSGYIFFSLESSDDYIKYKQDESSNAKRLSPKKIQAFVFRKDSFVVLQNVRMENAVGNLFNRKRIFAQVLQTGTVNLFLYRDAVDSVNRYENTQGYYYNSPVWGTNFTNYLLQKQGTAEIVGVRKRKYIKFKEQMIEFFDEFPEIQDKIRKNTYRWESLPGLILEVNSRD